MAIHSRKGLFGNICQYSPGLCILLSRRRRIGKSAVYRTVFELLPEIDRHQPVGDGCLCSAILAFALHIAACVSLAKFGHDEANPFPRRWR